MVVVVVWWVEVLTFERDEREGSWIGVARVRAVSSASKSRANSSKKKPSQKQK